MLTMPRSAWRWMAPAMLAIVMPAVAAAASAQASYPSAQATIPGTITTIGGGVGGPGPATTVGVNPCAVAYAGGSLYVTDILGDVISARLPVAVRQINVATGQLRTLAGNGTDASQGVPFADGTPAAQAGIADSCGIAVDHAGNLLVADSAAFEDGDMGGVPQGIRVVARSTGFYYGRHMVRGDIYTLVKSTPFAITPGAVAVDQAGNVLFVSADNKLRALAEKSGTFYGVAMTAGHLYRIAGGGTRVRSAVPARQASLDFTDNTGAYYGQIVAGLQIDHYGNAVIADHGNFLVRVVAAKAGTFYGRAMRAGYIYTIAGNGLANFSSGGLATRTGIGEPASLAVDHSGNIVTASTGRVLVLAVRSGRFYGQAMTALHIYRIAGELGKVPYSGDGGPALKADLFGSFGVAVDGYGNVAVANYESLRVIAARTGTFYGRRMRAGYIYRITGVGSPYTSPLLSGDGGPATRAEMQIGLVAGNLPPGAPLALDRSGDLLIANMNEVRVIPSAARTLFGVAMQAGHMYRLAGNILAGSGGDGGSALDAQLYFPDGIGADAAGNLMIADTGSNLVRVVAATTGAFYGQQMTAGDIYAVAGDGQSGEGGDGGPALDAQVGSPEGVTVDAAGNLLITSGCQVRVVATGTGKFYGQQMTAGDIYTIAGGGTCQTSGDGGPAQSADLSYPSAVIVDPAGNVLVAAGAVRVIAAKTGMFYGQKMTAGDIYSAAPAPTRPQWGLAVDGSGNLLFTDPVHNQVLVFAESNGKFYGQPMTAGQTYVIAGDGQFGHTGDGGSATKAALMMPDGIAVTSSGDVMFLQYHWVSEIAG